NPARVGLRDRLPNLLAPERGRVAGIRQKKALDRGARLGASETKKVTVRLAGQEIGFHASVQCLIAGLPERADHVALERLSQTVRTLPKAVRVVVRLSARKARVAQAVVVDRYVAANAADGRDPGLLLDADHFNPIRVAHRRDRIRIRVRQTYGEAAGLEQGFDPQGGLEVELE